jgi:hypothetical protein
VDRFTSYAKVSAFVKMLRAMRFDRIRLLDRYHDVVTGLFEEFWNLRGIDPSYWLAGLGMGVENECYRRSFLSVDRVWSK